MKDDWENIPQELKDALAKALTSNSKGEENADDYKYHVNDWIDGQKVNDAKFALYFLERHHMRCFHGVLFDMDGARNDSVIEQEIYSEIEPYVSAGIAKKAIKHNQNVPNEEGRKVRGFDGVHVMIRTNRFI